MSPLVVCAVGWLAGVLAGSSFVSFAWAGLMLAGMLLAWRASGRLASVGLALAACAGGGMARWGTPPEVPARAGVLEGVVARPVEELAGERRVVVELDGGARALVVEHGRGAPLFAGDRVRFRGQARPPRPPGLEGGLDRARYLAGRGIDLEARAEPPGLTRVASAPRGSLWRLASQARARAAEALAASSTGAFRDGAPLLQALVLGRRGEIRPELDDAFRRAGVAHVLSVSGVHLAAATLLVFALARALARRSAWLMNRTSASAAAAAAALPAALGYTLLTGAEVATVRALVCAAVVLGGRMLGRASDALTALAAAALILVVDSPDAVFEPSFQLSFSAAAGLALVAPRLRGRGRLVSALCASAAATLATAPLTASAFGVIQPWGVLVNLVVVPVAELLVLPLGLLAALLGMAAPELGASFAALGGLCAEGLARFVLALGRWLPVWEVPPPRPLELAGLGVAVVALLALPWRRALLPALAGVALCAGVELAIALDRPDELRVTFLDVGQGDAALIETPGAQRWLIDAGGRLFGDDGPDPGAALRRWLAWRRIGRLDLVVVSHPHPDHYGGLAALAGHVELGEVWASGDETADPRWEALRARLPLRTVAAGEARASAGARLELLAPPGGPDPLRSVNDNSLVARLSFAGRRVLFTGDVEAGAERALVAAGADVASDVVKVAHHGSRTSSSEPFVAATHPRLAVISLGAGNRFGFPAPGVVERWRAGGAEVRRTDEDGSVTVTVGRDGALGWKAQR